MSPYPLNIFTPPPNNGELRSPGFDLARSRRLAQFEHALRVRFSELLGIPIIGKPPDRKHSSA